MAIAGTEFVYTTHTADIAFFDTRSSTVIHAFTDSHGDDITEVSIRYRDEVLFSYLFILILCATDPVSPFNSNTILIGINGWHGKCL